MRVTRPHRWGFPCCVKVLCQRACVDYPGSRDGASVWRPSPGFRDVPWAIQKPGVPRSRGGSATAICIFEAHKTFTDVQACWLARSPKGTTTPRASDDLVASFAVWVATDNNTGCRVGLSPTGLSHLCTAHTRNRKRSVSARNQGKPASCSASRGTSPLAVSRSLPATKRLERNEWIGAIAYPVEYTHRQPPTWPNRRSRSRRTSLAGWWPRRRPAP